MDMELIKRIVRNNVLEYLCATESISMLPVAISNRHIHLCRKDVEILFGQGYQLTPAKQLSQPGQFACNETVTLKGSKKSIANVRVLGPERPQTQVEVSITDTFVLGVPQVIKMSGDLQGTPGITLIGPKGEVNLSQGLVVAKNHIHMSDEQARLYGVKNGDTVRIRKEGTRVVTFENVVIRSGNGHELEMHIDTDEGNAAQIKNGDLVRLISDDNVCIVPEVRAAVVNAPVPVQVAQTVSVPVPELPAKTDIKPGKKQLITERDILNLRNTNSAEIKCDKNCLITPLAKDKARELGIKITYTQQENCNGFM